MWNQTAVKSFHPLWHYVDSPDVAPNLVFFSVACVDLIAALFGIHCFITSLQRADCFVSHIELCSACVHSLKGSSVCVLASWPPRSRTTLVTTVTLTDIFHLRTPLCTVCTPTLSSTTLLSPQTTSWGLCWNCSHKTRLGPRGPLGTQRRRCGGPTIHGWGKSSW